jgi:hypothetical protein
MIRGYGSDIERHLCRSQCILPLTLVHLRPMLVSDISFEKRREISEFRALLSPQNFDMLYYNSFPNLAPICPQTS